MGLHAHPALFTQGGTLLDEGEVLSGFTPQLKQDLIDWSVAMDTAYTGIEGE